MNRRLTADLALAGCALLWGGTFVVVQWALADTSVMVFLAARFFLAAAVMAIVYRSDLRKISARELRVGALIGLCMFGGYVFQTAGLLKTTPSKAAFVTGFGVVLVPVLLAIFWRRRSNAWLWGGAFVSLAGLYYLTVPDGKFSQLNRGDLLMLICSTLFAFQIILIGRYGGQYPVGTMSFLQIATTALLSVVAVPVLALAGWEQPRLHRTVGLAAALATTAILATAVAFSTLVWAQRRTTPAHAALVLALEPVFAAMTSYILIHERLGARAVVGGILILSGIVAAELKSPIQNATSSPAGVEGSIPAAETNR